MLVLVHDLVVETLRDVRTQVARGKCQLKRPDYLKRTSQSQDAKYASAVTPHAPSTNVKT